jgi:uncharacterized protein (TIGR04562 family)
MPHRFNFDESILNSVVGGKSALEMPGLNFHAYKDAEDFLKAYGFDPNIPEDLEKLWYFHRRALVLMHEKLGITLEEIPELLREAKLLEHPVKLLLYASDHSDTILQKWSCAILRCMHAFVHAEYDLFSTFSEEIQKQILSPFQNCIYHDGTTGTTFIRKMQPHLPGNSDPETIALAGFESKPFKTSSSTVIKLLAKADYFAMNVLDKLGVRLVSKSMFDSFRVIRFLVEENLISYPHIMSDQSSNNLYPLNLFLRACVDLTKMANGKDLSIPEIDKYFQDYLLKNEAQGELLRKENAFSAANYKFIKFIARKLVRVQLPGQKSELSFFYPFEVQIMDFETHQQGMVGPSEHQSYKERQRMAAKKRLFNEDLKA